MRPTVSSASPTKNAIQIGKPVNGSEPLPTVLSAAAVPPPEDARLRFADAPRTPPEVVAFCVFPELPTAAVAAPATPLVDAWVDDDVVLPAAVDPDVVAVPAAPLLVLAAWPVPAVTLDPAAPLAVLVVPLASLDFDSFEPVVDSFSFSPDSDLVEPVADSFSPPLNEVEPVVDSCSELWHEAEPVVDSFSPPLNEVEPVVDSCPPAWDPAETVIEPFFRWPGANARAETLPLAPV
jgi:hypothetical protein